MDLVKMGSFLKELRKGKSLTQEQLAEHFGVSGRTVSRWENGNNMPDISILIELSDFYDVDIRELIDGERKSEDMNEALRDTLIKVAEYSDAEKEQMIASLVVGIVQAATIFLFLFIVLGLSEIEMIRKIANTSATFAALFGFFLLVGCIIRVMQIIGTMPKKRLQKMRKIGIIIFTVLFIICVAAIMLLTSSLF